MMHLSDLLLKGFSLGCIYALSSMGFVVIFKTSRIINLAHGQLMAAGAFIFLLLYSISTVPFFASFLLTVLICLGLVYIIERIFIRPMTRASMTRGIFMTLGIVLMLKGLISFFSGVPVEDLSKRMEIASPYVAILPLGVIFIVLFILLFRRSPLGLYIRAVSDNRKSALSLGVPINRLFTFSWLVAGTAAVIGGMLLAIGPGLNDGDLNHMESRIFPAIVIGGTGSMRGALLGGILIGMLETCAGYRDSGLLKDILPYLILLLVIAIRPYGLFSDKVDLSGIRE